MQQLPLDFTEPPVVHAQRPATIAEAGKPGLRPFHEARALLEHVRAVEAAKLPQAAPLPPIHPPPGANPKLFTKRG